MATITSDFDDYARVVIYEFDDNDQPTVKEIVGPLGNVVRGEIVDDRYLLSSSDLEKKPLTLKDLTSFDQIK